MRILLLLLAFLPALSGCSGSGAVNPLTPRKSGESTDGETKAPETVYWSTAPVNGAVKDTLNDVVLLGEKVGWACGAKTTLLKWDGKTWTKVQTGITLQQDLYSLSFSNENEGWAVGERGLILHYDQGKWVQAESPTGENLFDVAVLSSKSGWAVGDNGTLLSLNGGKIAAVTVGEFRQPLYAVGMSAAGNAWAVGERGSLLRFDGAAWSEFPGSPTSEKLRGLDVDSDAEAWAVGAYGTILRFNGTVWTRMSSPTSGADLYSIQILNGEEGWACGQDGALLYYDGSRWILNKPAVGRPSLNAVALWNADVGFVAGQNGTLLKFQPGGELSKGSLSLEGRAVEADAKRKKGEWTLTYTLVNAGAQSVPLVVFHLKVPKGFKPYPPPESAVPQPSVIPTAPPQDTPPTEGSSGEAPAPTPTPVAKDAAKPGQSSAWSKDDTRKPSAAPTPTPKGTPVAPWKMKKDLEWDLGNIAGSSSRTLTILLKPDAGVKAPAKAVLQANLVSKNDLVAEAVALTLGAEDKKAAKATPAPTKAGETPKPKEGETAPEPGDEELSAPAADTAPLPPKNPPPSGETKPAAPDAPPTVAP